MKKQNYTLEELLENCEPNLKPQPFDWGEDVGRERFWEETKDSEEEK